MTLTTTKGHWPPLSHDMRHMLPPSRTHQCGSLQAVATILFCGLAYCLSRFALRLYHATAGGRKWCVLDGTSETSGIADNSHCDPAQLCHIMTITIAAGREGERVSAAFISRC